MKMGKLEVDLNELQEFIVKAKKNGYAGDGEKIRELDDSKTFMFQEGNFHYIDNYAGSFQAPGTEIVRWQKPDGQRIWQMSYSGGMLSEYWGNKELAAQTFEFLKKTLMLSDFEHPFRGLPEFGDENFVYFMEMSGDIKRFSGKEHIYDKLARHTIFSQDFIGGLVIPK